MSDSGSLFTAFTVWYRAGPHERWRVYGTAWTRSAAVELMDRGGDWYLAEDGVDPDPNRRRRRKKPKKPEPPK